jgi:hypothetical protein
LIKLRFMLVSPSRPRGALGFDPPASYKVVRLLREAGLGQCQVRGGRPGGLNVFTCGFTEEDQLARMLFETLTSSLSRR